MALEHTINEETFSDLDAAIQQHYEKGDDGYHLQAVGLVPKSRLDDFRANNISLKQANEKFESDLASLNEQLSAAKKGIDEGTIDSMVEEKLKKRVKELTSDYESKISELSEGKEKAEGSLSKMLVSDAVSREAIAAGVKDTALEDVLTRASKVFKVVEGKATPFDGEEIIYGKDGTTPLTVKDWLAGQATTAPHLFKESTGSGASNDKKGGGAAKPTLTSTQKIAEGLKKL